MNKRNLFLFCTILLNLIWLTSCSARSNPSSDAFVNEILTAYPDLNNHAYESDIIKRVVDGDTFETKSGKKVRLIGVDTPESVKPNSPIEHFGKEASEFTKKQLTGKTVYLFKDVEDTDRYKRLLRYVFVEGQTLMYNESLIREGYANPMTVPPNVMYAKLFVTAEREAREQKKGFWADSTSSSNSSSDNKAAPGCPEPRIKGNINAEKEKIYHIPDGNSYNQTIAEQMFCTEEEAKASGYRKAKN